MSIREVLVTGANGHLAPYVIEQLRNRYQLTLTSRSEPAATFENTVFVQADLTDYDAIAACCAGKDAVVHLASVLDNRLELPTAVFADVMVKGAWHIAEACVRNGVTRVVHVSSILACGQPTDRSKPYRVGDPSGFVQRDMFYPLAKYLAEEIFDAYHQSFGLDVIHLRPGVIGGDPRYPHPRPPSDINENPYWFRHIDPRDLAWAVESALTAERTHGCYNIVAARRDAMFDWTEALDGLGFKPQQNWHEIPEAVSE